MPSTGIVATFVIVISSSPCVSCVSLRFATCSSPHRRGREAIPVLLARHDTPFTGNDAVRGGPVEHLAGTKHGRVPRVQRNGLGVLPILGNTRPRLEALALRYVVRPSVLARRVPRSPREDRPLLRDRAA